MNIFKYELPFKKNPRSKYAYFQGSMVKILEPNYSFNKIKEIMMKVV